MKKRKELLILDELGTTITGCDKEAKEIVIPDGVKVIGDNAFLNCRYLTSIRIPNSVTEIGDSAFYGCLSLSSIRILNSVTKIGNSAFYACYSLSSITISESVTVIGRSAFQHCNALTSIIIPNSVKEMGSYAFVGCNALTSINIPKHMSHIENNIFRDCSNLKTIKISKNHSFFKFENGKLIDKRTGRIVDLGNSNDLCVDYIEDQEKVDTYTFTSTNIDDVLQRLRELLEAELSKHNETKQEFEKFKRMADEKLKDYDNLLVELEMEKDRHEKTRQELEELREEFAKLKERLSEVLKNAITIDDMINIIGEQATADDAKTISEAIKTILMEKDMNLTAEQKKRMKAYLAKVGSSISVEKLFAPGSNYYDQKK